MVKSPVVLLFVCLIATRAFAQVTTFATWSSATSGSLNGVSITVSGDPFAGVASFSLNSPDFTPDSGGDDVDMFSYSVGQTITFTFAAPVSGLTLHTLFFRSANTYGPTYYDFSGTGLTGLSIVSGNADSSVSGYQWDVSSANWLNGSIALQGSVSSLTITPSFDAGGSGQLLTFSTTSAIPEPSTYALIFGVGALGCAVWLRRRRATA